MYAGSSCVSIQKKEEKAQSDDSTTRFRKITIHKDSCMCRSVFTIIFYECDASCKVQSAI